MIRYIFIWFICLNLKHNLVKATESITLSLTPNTTYQEALKHITEIHQNPNARFGKIETDQIEIFRDRYCYRRTCSYTSEGGTSCTTRRVGVCMRTRLELASKRSMFMYVREDGLYHHTNASGDYKRVKGKDRGIRWYEDYIEEQLELRTRTKLCVAPNITLEGKRPSTASLSSPVSCSKVCLGESTLSKLWHVRLLPWKNSFVWCIKTENNGRICATPWHVVRGENGRWITMDELCSNGKSKCIGKQEKVAKSILFTQYIGEYGVTFVAAETKWVRNMLICLQILIDVIVCITTSKWAIVGVCGISSYLAMRKSKNHGKSI